VEEFFYIGCQIDEVELMDLILRRYHTLDFIKELTVEGFCKIILKAIEGEDKENHRQEWLALLPTMITHGKYVSFKEYYDKVTGKNIDMRPAEEIIAEIDRAHEKAKENK
jgi:hypothetical protein